MEEELKTETTIIPRPEEEAPPEKNLPRKKRWKAHKKAKKAEKKAAKKAKRAALKEDYRDAPFLLKIFRLYLLKPLAWILGIVLAIYLFGPAFLVSDLFVSALQRYVDYLKKQPVAEEQILEKAPLDVEGRERIKALPSSSPDDTWTICVYMVGANLEDDNENDLSPLTRYLTEPIAQANSEASQALSFDRISTFTAEISEKGMQLPEYLYLPQTPVAFSQTLTEDVVVSSRDGCASLDINEMILADLPESVSVVVQTGGATRWSNGMVNPNKTQRFLIQNGGFEEVSNLPLQDSCAPETLSEFLRFCKDEYPADHQILVFWDHGGAAFGYGGDSIFGTTMSLSDLREALSAVYRPNEKNPPFELIGFDACLMASTEVAHALDGFGRYLAASEESEPGDGWDYTSWLSALGADLSMSGAEVAMNIADSYMNYYLKENCQTGSLTGETMVQFSVADIAAANRAYEAYCNLAAAELKAAIHDPAVLTEIGRAASRAVRYAENSYRVFNTIDLGGYAAGLVEIFPEESTAVTEAVEEAVLYKRANGYLAESQGLSIYMPVQIEGLGGIDYYLCYLNDICDNDDIRTLYYYKLAGCLNDELQEYASSQGYGEAKLLDITPLRKLVAEEPSVAGGDYSLPVSDAAAELMQTYQMYLAWLDPVTDELYSLGADNFAVLDGEGNLLTDFDAEWVTLGGQLLPVEIVDETSSFVKYRSKVSYNGKESWLLFTYDIDTDAFTVQGIREIPTDVSGYLADVADRMLNPLTIGDRITPLYDVTDLATGITSTQEGKAVVFRSGTNVEISPLNSGTYLSFIVVTDPRGDEYYTQVMEYTLKNGEVTSLTANDDYYVVATED